MSWNQFYFQSGYLLTIGTLLFPESPLSMRTHYPSQTKKQELLFDKNIILIGNPNNTEYEIVIKIPPMEQIQIPQTKYHMINAYQPFFEYGHPAFFYLHELETFKLQGTPVFFCLQRTKPNHWMLDTTYDTVVVDEVQIEESGALGRERKLTITLVRYTTAKNQPFVVQDQNIQNTEELTIVSNLLSQNSNRERVDSVDIHKSNLENQFENVNLNATAQEIQNVLQTQQHTNVDTSQYASSSLKKFLDQPQKYPIPPYMVQTKRIQKFKNFVRAIL